MSALEPVELTATMQYIENKTYDEIAVGDRAELTPTPKQQDIELFAVMSGDVNPAHVDAVYARTDMFHGVIAHDMWGGALISAVLVTELPGPGTIFLNQSLKFDAPVGLGDTVTVRVEVSEKLEKGRLLLACTCLNQNGRTVVEGVARVIAPREKVRRAQFDSPCDRYGRDRRHRIHSRVGENSALVRRLICERLAWLGVDLDVTANERGIAHFQSTASDVTVIVIPSDEEAVIAAKTHMLTRSVRASQVQSYKIE
jgi:acyl dehydratase